MKYPQRFRRVVLLLALAAPVVAAPAIAATATPAANVTLVTGRGTASSRVDGIRTLAKGDAVYSGEIVHSSAGSYVDLKFSDGGYFLLRPNTRFQVVDFANHGGSTEAAPAAVAPKAPAPTAPAPPPLVAAAPPAAAPAPAAPPAPPPEVAAAPAAPAAPLVTAQQGNQNGASRAFFSLLKGGFRSISGLIGKINHDEYQVSTPVATIGIRGTDYLVVMCDATCATDPEILKVVPPGVSPMGGIVSTVYSHSIVINDAGGSVTLLEGQFLLVLPNGTNIMLPGEPHFLKVDPTPNPATCSG